MSRIEQFIIKSTRLHVCNGVFSCHILLKATHKEMVFGGFYLDKYCPLESRRMGIGFGTELLKRVIEVIGSPDWESLSGKECRALVNGPSVLAIGHITDNKWFNPTEMYADFERKENIG